MYLYYFNFLIIFNIGTHASSVSVAYILAKNNDN